MNNSYCELYRKLKEITIINELAEMELNSGNSFSLDDLIKISNDAGINIITREEINFKKFILSNNKYLKLDKELKDFINSLPKSISKEEKVIYFKKIKDLSSKKESFYNSLKEEFFNGN